MYMKRLMLLGLLMLVGCSSEEVSEPKKEPKIVEEKKTETEKKVEPKEEVKKENTIRKPTTPAPNTPVQNFTVDTFTNAINSAYQASSPNNENPNHAPLMNEDEKAVTYIISPNTAIIADLNEKGLVKKVSVLNILEGSTHIDRIEFILAMGIVVSVLNPELEAEKRGSLLVNDLEINQVLEDGNGSTLTFQGSNVYEFISNTIVGGVQLTVIPSTNPNF